MEFHLSDVDYLVEADYPVPVIAQRGTEREGHRSIGNFDRRIKIHDGDSIQLGIGGMPNAVARALDRIRKTWASTPKCSRPE
ncbi:MAG: hypothetical protein MZU97_24295 [Bacillus subtilis]|nr:hypothetical protein [Bacillus subtilis]